MSTFVLMRLLESAPRRYDFGIWLVSLGRITSLRRRMADQVQSGDRVLDIGCGTGSVALLCAGKGARVTAIDISPQMLDVARAKAAAAGLDKNIEFRQMSAIDLDEAFEDGSFEVVVSSLMFSELSPDEQDFVLAQCHRLLSPRGRLVIADEVVPERWPLRLLATVLRLPLVAVTYVLTQTTTRAVTGLWQKVSDARFTLTGIESSLLGGLQMVVAAKSGDGE